MSIWSHCANDVDRLMPQILFAPLLFDRTGREEVEQMRADGGVDDGDREEDVPDEIVLRQRGNETCCKIAGRRLKAPRGDDKSERGEAEQPDAAR
jgi:hypothetical protein